MVKDTIPEKCKITELLTTLHAASKWYHILRYIKSNAQVQRFNLAHFIDSDLHFSGIVSLTIRATLSLIFTLTTFVLSTNIADRRSITSLCYNHRVIC